MKMKLGLLLTGIAFIALALILFIVDIARKKDGTEEIKKINADAEQLLEELNTISTLIVDEMDKRYNRMLEVYREFENMIGCRDSALQEGLVNGTTTDIIGENTVYCKEDSRRKELILGLYRKGFTPSEIAKKFNIGTGEVELIIKLMNRGVKENAEVL